MTDHAEPVCFRCQLSLSRCSYTYREGRPIHLECLRPEDTAAVSAEGAPVYTAPPVTRGLRVEPAPGLSARDLEETNRVIHLAGLASTTKSLRDERAASYPIPLAAGEVPGPGPLHGEPEPVPLAPPEEAPAYRTAYRLGVKADGGKAQWSLIPWEALAEIVAVLDYGARKYAPDNWRHVPDARRRYTDALFRHVVAWCLGEVRDSESGLTHLAHAGCCILFLLAFESGTHGQNRPNAQNPGGPDKA